MSAMLYPRIVFVALSMDLFVLCVACLTVFCELFGKTIRNMFGGSCYFVGECYGGV